MKLADDLGRKIILNRRPERVISLCPSITETLFDLGLGDLLIGRTDYCVHPAGKLNSVQSVGGPRDVSIIKVEMLCPDIILAVKEENAKKTVEILSSLHYKCFVFDVNSFSDGLKMIETIGRIFSIVYKARKLTDKITAKFKTFKGRTEKPHFLYMVWNSPYMAAGPGNYINSLLSGLGFNNCLSSESEKYVTLPLKKMKNLSPDIVFLPSEPYCYKDHDKEEFEKIFPRSRVVLVDGEMFCWYGSRMLAAGGYLQDLFERIGVL